MPAAIAYLYVCITPLKMIRAIILLLILSVNFISCRSQSAGNDAKGMAASAVAFLQTLSANQKAKAQFSFTDDERYNWHFVPKSRKGIPLKDLDVSQREAAFKLL
ncbi:MAG TPA: DUF3500 domain-containing protein, partial [Chitinophagaceae bacterium]|nr:DUF3500 domain-containing protein [Chitinophagaceae bacterium]